jgi:hypothetical protein
MLPTGKGVSLLWRTPERLNRDVGSVRHVQLPQYEITSTRFNRRDQRVKDPVVYIGTELRVQGGEPIASVAQSF